MTVYELRISAWSSDVCFSFLTFVLRSVPLNWFLILCRMLLSARFCLAVSRCVLHSRPVSVSWGGSIRPPRGTAEQCDEEYQAVSSAIGGLLVAQSDSRECPDQIGRASCRERVWQYV